jgi:hypothetical protein
MRGDVQMKEEQAELNFRQWMQERSKRRQPLFEEHERLFFESLNTTDDNLRKELDAKREKVFAELLKTFGK